VDRQSDQAERDEEPNECSIRNVVTTKIEPWYFLTDSVN